jgi:hypothetical protein
LSVLADAILNSTLRTSLSSLSSGVSAEAILEAGSEKVLACTGRT